MYFLKIVNFSEDPVKEEPATAAPPLHAKTILRLSHHLLKISFYVKLVKKGKQKGVPFLGHFPAGCGIHLVFEQKQLVMEMLNG